MNTNPAKAPKDRLLFARLIAAHKAGVMAISADAPRLNHPGSPVWEPGENVAPILAMLFISVVCLFVVNLMVGTAMTVLSVLVYLFLIRPWIFRRVSQRAIDAATSNLHNWEILWKTGSLALVFSGLTSARCKSPAGDWRSFVTHCLPKIDVDRTEAHKDFMRAERDNADVETVTDVHM
jgi:hypothetical protein